MPSRDASNRNSWFQKAKALETERGAGDMEATEDLTRWKETSLLGSACPCGTC